MKDLFIAALCYWYIHGIRPVRPGRTFAFFLILYGVFRFLLEYLRAQDQPLINLGILHVSFGQLLTIPILFVGILLWNWLRGEVEASYALERNDIR